ncbi:MAG: hypothetical protein IJ794_18810 [Lachnospiraceae bacterium]|nr:hypothetical protein [Lachnospiraceae bacterium]
MLSMKCKICGGDIANDYLIGACVCENCGNRWAMAELVPNYKDYTHVIEKLNRANELVADREDAVMAGQAILLYKSVSMECVKHADEIASDLMRISKEGLSRAEQVKHYATAKAHFEKKAYRKALSEFEKAKGMKDVDEMIERCQEEIAAARKRRIPYAVFIGMIIPAIVCLFLKERFGVPVGLAIPLFLAGTAGLGFAVYLDGTLSVIVEIASFLLLVPLLLFLVLAYGVHMSAGPAACIAVGVPLGIVVTMAVLAERE